LNVGGDGATTVCADFPPPPSPANEQPGNNSAVSSMMETQNSQIYYSKDIYLKKLFYTPHNGRMELSAIRWAYRL